MEECSASEETCSGGQEWNQCGLACLRTCSDPDPVCTKNCVPRCQCPADKPIWKEGECVAVSECDSSQCKSNLVFNECGSACTPSCRDPDPMCTEQCVPRCECPKDLPIFHQRVCTTEETCPDIPEPGALMFPFVILRNVPVFHFVDESYIMIIVSLLKPSYFRMQRRNGVCGVWEQLHPDMCST